MTLASFKQVFPHQCGERRTARLCLSSQAQPSFLSSMPVCLADLFQMSLLVQEAGMVCIAHLLFFNTGVPCKGEKKLGEHSSRPFLALQLPADSGRAQNTPEFQAF